MERVIDVGEVEDEEVSRLAITQHIVVTGFGVFSSTVVGADTQD